MKLLKLLLICAVLFATVSASFAAEYWVIRQNGKLIVVESRPADAGVIVKGPFTTRQEADVIVANPPAGALVAPGPAPGPPPGPPAPVGPPKPAPVPPPPAAR